MLFRRYSTATQPTKVKIGDVDNAHVLAIYELIKAKGSSAEAWKQEVDGSGAPIAKDPSVDYKLYVYKQIEDAVKDIVQFTEQAMQSASPPATRQELNQMIQDSNLKIVGLPLSTIITDMIAYSDGDPNSGTTWAQFKLFFQV